MTTQSAGMKKEGKNPDLKDTGYELFILLLSVVSIINLTIVVFGPWFGVYEALLEVIYIINGILTIFFIIDFCYRFFTTDSKKNYFFKNWGWTDLLACIPTFRIFRLFRIIKAVRLMRIFGLKNMMYEIVDNRAGSALYLSIFGIIMVAEVAGVVVLNAELKDPAAANIVDAGDAIWWVMVTLTTVGYGDQYPVTPVGRIAGIFVMFSGVALIGVLASYLSSFFMEETPPRDSEEHVSDDPQSILVDLKTLLAQQQTAQEALMKKVSELETKLAEAPSQPVPQAE
jgi:voltage-gated potassium channel